LIQVLVAALLRLNPESTWVALVFAQSLCFSSLGLLSFLSTGNTSKDEVLLVRLFINPHSLKPIQLPGADNLVDSHAVQKPQITSTSDRLPNMARHPVINLQTDPMLSWCDI
jgi:hypothetical protein